MELSVQNQLNQLRTNGFTVIKNKRELIQPIYEDVKATLKSLLQKKKYDYLDLVDKDLHAATAKVGLIDRDLIGNLYDISRTSLSTFLLVSDITIRSIISNYLSSEYFPTY